ncbi:MAG TPA: pyridoxamine 5'-phosphate oxidase family protein [Candidatus Hodarchaeales archaeon]|nr:pyridoxamine 5'-phosphate oxidase family protein [Candidatus Hodarchaeales archaeon]
MSCSFQPCPDPIEPTKVEPTEDELAANIIASSFYLTTATYDYAGDCSWAAPVMFWMDDQQHFYFVSAFHSRHVKNIHLNSNIGISIYDSQQLEGTGRGVQFGAKAVILRNKKERSMAAYWLAKTRAPKECLDPLDPDQDDPLDQARSMAKRWQKNGRVIFKLTVDSQGFFINAWDGQVDTRQSVTIPTQLNLKWFHPDGSRF